MCNYHKYFCSAALKAYLLIQRILFVALRVERERR